MAVSTTPTGKVADALRIFKSLPDADRSYHAVAEAMNITDQRASEYVRRAARMTGETDLLPRSTRGGGRKPKPVSPAEVQMQALIDALDEQVNGYETRLNEAKSNLAQITDDPEAAIASETRRLDEAAKSARERATEFAKKKAVQAEWLTAEQERLTERVTQVENDANEQVEAAKRERERIETVLAMLADTEA